MYPVPGFWIEVAITAPDPLLKVIEPKKPLPETPESPTFVTVVPRRAWQDPVTVHPATQEGAASVAAAVAPDPPPEKDTVGGTA
jgi:hypothetical protein